MAEGIDQRIVVPASKILAEILRGKQIDYDHVIIEGDLDITKKSKSRERENIPSIESIRITNSKIEGKFSIGEISIKGRAIFENTQFCKEVVFSSVQFNMLAKFNESLFNGRAFFMDSQFRGNAFFIGANFKDLSLFNRSKFNNNASFFKAEFENDVAFNRAEFFGSANFTKARFGTHLFENQRFEEFPHRKDTNLKADLKSRRGTNKEGRALFIGVQFKNSAFFDGANFNSDAIFYNAYFLGHASFMNALFGGSCDFKQARFQRVADFKGVIFENETKLDLRGSEFNIFKIKWSTIQSIFIYDSQLFISLVKNYEKLGWTEDANKCYYAYRVFNRSSMHFGFSKLVDVLEDLVIGYGVRPFNIILITIPIILFFGAIYFYWDGVCINKSCSYNCSPCSISINESLLFSLIVFAAKIPTDLRAIGGFNWIASLESILGWFVLGIIMSAITKRIKL
ncbi:MAG: pentapeptide repeat-containing protein [Methanothrix sp.]|nr:pentapeptide repeat-containing protein [Methanothrix sp.]